MKNVFRLAVCVSLLTVAVGCPAPEEPETEDETAVNEIAERLERYTTVRLTTDLSVLTEAERQMLPLLIEAADTMNEAFWYQAYGDRVALMNSLESEEMKRYAEINYGPWDRLDGNEPFVSGVGPKPPGANLYPADVTKEEVENAILQDPAIGDLYTLVRRSEGGALEAVPYSQAFAASYGRAAEKLRQAAELAEEPGLKKYLELRAEALLSDDYRASDLAWMDMKDNGLDVVIGPIESYEDGLLGTKTASEGYVLVKDREWSDRLSRYAALLPALQEGLPVDEAYKQEEPGTDSDLNAYDVVYYAGDCNAGSKTIAINLPNDEEVQLARGTRRLQLKNAMRAKFDEILVPIAGVLVAEEQRSHVTFGAFFSNTMFHEVAHGLGIKNTLDGAGTVREALQEHASALEEGKADVLGLYMVGRLHADGELGEADLMDNHVTFLASIFRSIRFGSASAHGVANLIRFNYFLEQGAIERSAETGQYRVLPEKIDEVIDSLSEKILRLQGDGEYDAVASFVATYGRQSAQLEEDLARLATAGIPVDIVFEQGVEVLGL
ncbi:MAG: Zn-dependent hydrolase [Acidobacteriota bacterium]